jgi:hypothetical protein
MGHWSITVPCCVAIGMFIGSQSAFWRSFFPGPVLFLGELPNRGEFIDPLRRLPVLVGETADQQLAWTR